jgi:parvulin-like peptidyl-prolyl isomerase
MRNTSAVVVLVALLAAVPAALVAAEVINRVVLRVNDRIATLEEFVVRRNARLQAITEAEGLTAEQRSELTADAGPATMREIFEELLLLSRAQQLRLDVAPGEIDQAMESTRRRFGIRNDEEFEEALARSGSSLVEFRDRTRRQLLFNEVMRSEVSPKISIDDEEVATYWRDHPDEFAVPERRRIEEAVVRETSPREPAERRRLAAEIRDAVVAGESIAEVVARLAVGDEVLVLDHGWIARGELERSLDTAAWELDAGGVAGPIDGRGGLHVLRVVEIEEASVEPLEKVREALTEKLHGERYNEESAKLLASLERRAYVVENVPEEASGYRTAPSSENDPLRALLREAEAGLEAPAETEAPAAPEVPAELEPPADEITP